jgi:membrane-associated phospholipid phosphatase
VLASEYKEYPLVAYLSYGVATLTGLSRMNDDKHFASDVFLGAAIGYFTAKTIMKLHSNKNGLHYTGNRPGTSASILRDVFLGEMRFFGRGRNRARL